MKSFLKNVFRKNLYLILAALILFALSYFLNLYLRGNTSTKLLRNSIESFLQKRESDYSKLSKDSVLIQQLLNQEYSKSQLDELLENQYGLLLYAKDTSGRFSLRFWSDQSSVLPDSLLNSKDGNYFVRLSNGQFEFLKRTRAGEDGGPILVIALIPVRWQYYISPEYLKPEFVGAPSAENRVHITFERTDFPVTSSFGNILFYLQKNEGYHAAKYSWLLLSLTFCSVLLLLVVIHNISHSIAENFGRFTGILFLTLMVILLRAIVYAFPSLLPLRQYELFDPTIYSSNFVLRSLGDLLINALLFCWIILFIKQEIGDYTFPLWHNRWKRWLLAGFILAFLVISTFIYADIVQSLVADARISFNVTNFFSLNIYSFIGFIVLAALALSYSLFSQILLQLVRSCIAERSVIAYIIIAFTGLLFLTFSRNIEIVELNIYVLLWLLLYVWVLQQNIFSGFDNKMNVSEVLFWLFVFSISMSVIIIFENQKKEFMQREKFADRLAEQFNPTSEIMVSMSLVYFGNDFLYTNFERFKEPQSNHSLKDSLISINYTGYNNEYDTKIYTYDSAEKPLYNQDSVSFDALNTIYKVQAKSNPTNPDLKYYESSYDQFAYIFKKTVQDPKQRTVGFIFILSQPKKYKGGNLVPELTQQGKEFVPEYSPMYSYAIYSDNDLVSYYNNYPFPTELPDSIIPRTDFYQKKNGAYEELWHLLPNDKIIIIAKKDNLLIEGITLFAYLFSSFLLLFALFWFASVLIQTRLHWSRIQDFLQLNIRSQIHTTIIFVSLFLFIVIGVATIFFLINRYNRNNQDLLSHTLKVMANEIQNKLPTLSNSSDTVQLQKLIPKEELENLISNLAEIHGAITNLYDVGGKLIVSSNPVVYTKGILSEQMHPLAYYYMHRLNSIEYFNNEKMGRISYQSIYCPVRTGGGGTCAYLNIPSFNTEEELNDEISKFLVTIINLNVFIFLIAGTIALFLTNRITSSFMLISEKMRQVNLSKTNEVIEWDKNDEIGGLIKEYNRMVQQLEDSAAALAKSEREGAWREMARQVAHEIKNPLTPMKLSIQYLQKAINNDSENTKELTANVAKTLVEQIDHLSKIAADFSQFANIGNPKNEVFDLHEMLYSLTSLYETTENLLFKWVPVRQRIMVYADKTQLNRLFTNLLQNALEACNGLDKCVVSVSEELKDDVVIVKVTDNGEGIPEHMHSKIFMPNFTTKSSGTGLGLAMSKTIVEQARGKIWFKTKEGLGTTFFVELPILRATST